MTSLEKHHTKGHFNGFLFGNFFFVRAKKKFAFGEKSGNQLFMKYE